MGLFRKTEIRSHDGPRLSIGDPALAEYLGMSERSYAGVPVTESSTLGLSAVFRAVSIISGTIAGLPLKTYRESNGQRERVGSFLDNPGGELLTPFEWTELVLVHLLLHGNAYLLHVYNGAGGIVSTFPLHPGLVYVEPSEQYGKIFKVTGSDGETREYTPRDLTHIPGLGTDGIKGLSVLALARNSFGTSIAGEQAAARMFGNGLLLGGMVTSDEQLTEEDAKTVMLGLKGKMQGTKNAGDLAFVNASLKFTPWTVPAKDAQFIESRQHQITDIARWFGVPKMLLAEDGASTWGSGIAELNRGLHRYTLIGWTSRIEQRLSRLLPQPRFCEFDPAGLLAGTPQEVTQNIAAELAAGTLTLDEARRILNRPPLSASTEAPSTEE